MKIVGGLITAGSGSMGGITASHNRYGYYVRNRVVPVNPSTIYQMNVRGAFADAMAAWLNELSAAERAAWDTYGQNVAMTDRTGRTIYLPGQQHFLRHAVLYAQCGEAPVYPGPTTYSLAQEDPSLAGACAHTTTLNLTFDNTQPWAQATGNYLMLFASRPQNSTVNFFKGPYRLTQALQGVANPPGPAPVSPHAFTLLQAPVAGQKIFWQARIVMSDGRISGVMRGVTTST